MILDEQTISKILENDRRTILALYHYTFNVLMNSVVRYKNNQEDQMAIVNSSFLKIVKNINKYKIGTAYFSWAKRIVQNEIIDNFRKDKNYNTFFDSEIDETEVEIEMHSEIDFQTEEEELLIMLNKLPPATKVVFNLFAIEGYSYKEIAEKLEITKETVKWHMKSARKNLKQQLIKETIN